MATAPKSLDTPSIEPLIDGDGKLKLKGKYNKIIGEHLLSRDQESLTPLISKDDTSSSEESEAADTSESERTVDGTTAERGLEDTSKTLFGIPAECDCCLEWVPTMPASMKKGSKAANTDKHAFLVRVQANHGGDFEGQRKIVLHSIVIQSPLLKTVLKNDIFDNYPSLTFNSKDPKYFAPFRPFLYRWRKLEEAAARAKDEKTKTHLKLLISTLRPELHESIVAIEDFVTHNSISFAQLWAVFTPGCVVCTSRDKADCCFILDKIEDIKGQQTKGYRLNCHFVDWDGTRFGIIRHSIEIWEYKGSVGREDLQAYPLEFHPQKAELRARLIQRGRKFEALSGFNFMAYEGIGIDNKSKFMGGDESVFHVNGRIVIDAKSYARFNPRIDITVQPFITKRLEIESESSDSESCEEEIRHSIRRPRQPFPQPFPDPYPSSRYEKRINIPTDARRLEDEEALICRHMVRGYTLTVKKWLDFHVDDVKDIKWNELAFEHLVLEEDYKNLLLELARSQSHHGEDFDDIIEGKGKGLVILLKGPPGVGKTLTAESVAETMRVPLYCISAGDLGIVAEKVQHTLMTVFQIVKSWNAVLLIDEADIFLEARTVNNLQRNELVSIFLQNLEHYEGTLFLTTNRSETFDPAFESRIHLQIPYFDLTISSRRQVWSNFLDRMPVGAHSVTGTELDGFAEMEVNGRQVKNVMKIASLLAMSQKTPLSAAHIQSVYKVMSK